MNETTHEHSAAQPQPKNSHRRDAELAEEERRKRNSLRTPRLCGEKDVEENPYEVEDRSHTGC